MIESICYDEVRQLNVNNGEVWFNITNLAVLHAVHTDATKGGILVYTSYMTLIAST